jgi:hypothetical protein
MVSLNPIFIKAIFHFGLLFTMNKLSRMSETKVMGFVSLIAAVALTVTIIVMNEHLNLMIHCRDPSIKQMITIFIACS